MSKAHALEGVGSIEFFSSADLEKRFWHQPKVGVFGKRRSQGESSTDKAKVLMDGQLAVGSNENITY